MEISQIPTKFSFSDEAYDRAEEHRDGTQEQRAIFGFGLERKERFELRKRERVVSKREKNFGEMGVNR